GLSERSESKPELRPGSALAEELLDIGEICLGRGLLTPEPEARPGRGAGWEAGVLRGALGRVTRARSALGLALLAALRRCTGTPHAGYRPHTGDVGRTAAGDGLHHLGS